MSTRLSGRNPLAYLGVEALTPPNMITSPVSPTAESRNANVGDYWLNTTNSNLYILASLSDMAATWVLIHSTVSSIDFVTNSGTAIPAANIINLLGGTGISTSASGNTINVILSTPVSIANGGTNATSMPNSNGVVYYDGTKLTTTSVGSSGQVLTSQGVGMPPHFAALPASSITITGDSGGGLTGNSFTFTGGASGLTFSGAGTTETLGGILVVSNGGTGANTLTAHGVLLGEGSSAITATAVGTNGQVLIGSSAANPGWVTPTAGTGLSITSNATTLQYALSTPVSIANGGTNATSMTTTDGTVIFDGTRLVTTTTGTSGQVLTSNGAGVAPTYQPVSASGAVTSVSGGNNITITGTATAPIVNVSGTTNHAVQIGNSTNSLSSLTVGTNGQVLLGSSAADPAFITPTAGTGLSITSNASTLQYALSAPVSVANGGTGDTSLTAYAVLCGGTTSTNPIQSIASVGTSGQILTSNGAAALPTFQSPAASSISITGDSGGALTGNSFTFTGGTTGLTFAGAGSTETLGGTLVVANGGTGATSLTSHSLLLGNGTSAVSALGAATNGQIPIGNTGNAPSLATITAGSGITVTNGAGTITIAASGSGITTLNGNSGSATGSTVTVTTSTLNANGTSKFSGASSTLSLNYEDANGNVGFGNSSLSNSGTGSPSGTNNSALGHTSGFAITSGSENVALGHGATSTVTSGSHNIGIGTQALGQNGVGGVTTGSFNIGIGEQTGVFVGGASAYNVIIGYQSGGNLVGGTRSSNVYLNNGSNGSGESNAFRVGSGTGTGNQNINSAFVCGIQGITVTGTAVLISSSDQLGIAVSSRRFKSDIQDMKEDSSALYKLRPVSFVWDRNSAPGLKDATDLRQYGLIAEEAAPIIPHAVNLDKEGQPLNINYQDLIGMMINEIQKLRKEIDALSAYAKAPADLRKGEQ